MYNNKMKCFAKFQNFSLKNKIYSKVAQLHLTDSSGVINFPNRSAQRCFALILGIYTEHTAIHHHKKSGDPRARWQSVFCQFGAIEAHEVRVVAAN